MEDSDKTFFLSQIQMWFLDCLSAIRGLRDYIEDVGEVGYRILNVQWSRAVDEIDLINKRLIHLKDLVDQTIFQDLASLFDLCDNIESYLCILLLSRNTIFNSEVRNWAHTRMSGTYRENIRGLSRQIDSKLSAARERVEVLVLQGVKLAPHFSSKMSIQQVDLYYGTVGGFKRKKISTEIYLHILVCLGGGDSLEKAKERAMGLEYDSWEIVRDEGERLLSSLHPLQTMCYAPLLQTEFREEGGAPIDLSLPQATILVTYDPNSLIHRECALGFGPIVAPTSGINYKIIQRFQTFKTRVRKITGERDGERSGHPPFCAAWLRSTPLPITLDEGATIKNLRPLMDSAWAPFSGVSKRVGMYNRCETSIIQHIRSEEGGRWGPNIRNLYYDTMNHSQETYFSETFIRDLSENFMKEADYKIVPQDRAIKRVVAKYILSKIDQILLPLLRDKDYHNYRRESFLNLASRINKLTLFLSQKIQEIQNSIPFREEASEEGLPKRQKLKEYYSRVLKKVFSEPILREDVPIKIYALLYTKAGLQSHI